jgi:aryl-alcohol dehydrogenase-like predicted oxidoreductase
VNNPVPHQQIALGTVQFGLPYGITNTGGQVGPDEAVRMLDTAWKGGIRLLDTAVAYGSSEASLGSAIQAAPARAWRVITKTLPLRKDAISASDVAAVADAFAGSLQRLRTARVDTLLVHHAQDLLAPGGEALWDWMLARKTAGQCLRLGASIYDGAEASRLLERFPIDVAQLPASLADQRLLQDGTVARLRQAGVEVHVRSLYLQGLLLADAAFVAARFPAQAAWASAFRADCEARGISPLQACIGFFRSQSAFGVAVVGATRTQELESMLDAWNNAPQQDWSRWAVDSPQFTDPREWKAA